MKEERRKELLAVSNRWRTGRKIGRTVYVQMGDIPHDDDLLIGMMDSPALATEAVNAHNLAGGWA